MSAGTIFCMSGNRIYMDYSSSLGPIDPQVQTKNLEWVPALGYLDQVERLIAKSADGSITDAELMILRNFDMAMLNAYEQAKNLTTTLLKNWLVEYKFADWTEHSKSGTPITLEEKRARAEEIAEMLSNNKLWHSHGRKIGAKTLSAVLRLRIEDYSADSDLRTKIRSYSDFMTEVIHRERIEFFLHSRRSF